MIDSYQFGLIIINKIPYDHDVIILPDRVQSNWWRKEGHKLHSVDIQNEIDLIQPQSLIVGTGKFGIMKVSQELKDYLEKHHIELYAESTDKAVKIYNRIILNEVNVLGAFHLTC
ncbi:MTH938/NDUFAF3 family protein [bacterium]|nr:MTH938/NDUFAF3 family protein [bacterium]